MPRQTSGTNGPGASQDNNQRSQSAIRSNAGAAPDDRVDFDHFSLFPRQRLLLRDGKPVPIGARAFDILAALATRGDGGLMTKEELIAAVWPTTFVEPSNLRVQMVALRKALGDCEGRLISTDHGRGYRLTARLGRAGTAPPLAPRRHAAPVSELPAAITRIIGRSEFIDALAAQLPRRRLITITGPGGIGKTRVALACAAALAGAYRDGVHFVDLTTVTDPASVPATLAKLLGVAVDTDDLLHDVVQNLWQREMLLIIDNCEHVVDAAARLVEAITTSAPGVHILATSRKSLRVTGEWVQVLPPLPSPPDATDLTAADALNYPAVELFVDRAVAAQHGFSLSDAEAPLVADICRRLDGVALAIELAAAKLHAFGVKWLAEHLDDPLSILNGGRRTAVPRHQNLAAMLDWSYDLLTEQERAMLRRLAMFPGNFTMAEAIGAAADDEIDDGQVVCAVGDLISKSLAMLDVSGPITRYRLPQTTRAYACAKLRMVGPGMRRPFIPAAALVEAGK